MNTDQNRVHPTAQMAHGAVLGAGVVIGPGAVIGAAVILGDGVRVGAYAVIEGRTTIGENSRIGAHATLGTAPQDLSYNDEDTELVIGPRNDIREYVLISRGTVKGGGRTVVGEGNMLMAYSHLGHDVQMGGHCIVTNGVQISGHVVIDDYAVFGGMSGVHQFARVGTLAMVAAGAILTQDVPPFFMVQGDRARPVGLNRVGLRRHGGYRLEKVRLLYRLLYRSGLGIEEALARIEVEVADGPERRCMVDFLRSSRRGICR